MTVLDKPFDVLKVGDRARTAGRTMTETDVVNFCMISGNWIEIHTNVEFAKESHFGKRLVQGSLVFTVIAGLLSFGPFITAFYGVDKLRFTAPVFIGDTVYVEPQIIDLTARDEQHGIVTLRIDVKNQRDEVVQTSNWRILMQRKDRRST